MRNLECKARTAEDIRLHAEKAAFKGQKIQALFNNLEGRTFQLLSPETMIFAAVCYEQKLVEYVVTALIECAKSDDGRMMAIRLLNASQSNNIESMWKPLLDRCFQLLRSLKMEATTARLSRLSELWSESDHEAEQAERLRKIIHKAISIEQYQIMENPCQEILDWIELYSVPNGTSQGTAIVFDFRELRERQSYIIEVDHSESFAAAETLLMRELAKDRPIHVLVGNEDDAARFYKAIHDRFANVGVRMIWRDKIYGQQQSAKIEIGSVRNFVSSAAADRRQISAIFLHAEQGLAESFETRSVPGSLDDFLAELFVVTTITLGQYDQILQTMNAIGYTKDYREYSDRLKVLDSCWPSEYKILDEHKVTQLYSRLCGYYDRPSREQKLKEHLKEHAISLIKGKIRLFELPHNLRGYIDKHCSKFVRSAIVAISCELGRDYVVYSERSSGALRLKIRLKKQLKAAFGLLQFLEMSHGFEMTPYRVYKRTLSTDEAIKSFNRVFIIHRRNPCRSYSEIASRLSLHVIGRRTNNKIIRITSQISDFSELINTEVQIYKEYLVIVVCPSSPVLLDVYNRLNLNNDGTVSICETPLGVLNESKKKTTGTMVVCTTSVCFEGWTFIPRGRKNLRIFVCHHSMDSSSLATAADLVHPMEICSVTVQNDDLERFTEFNRDREFNNSRIKSAISKRSDGSASNPEVLIDKYRKEGDVIDLLDAKRLLHQRIRTLTVAAKVVCAGLPTEYLLTADSPMDISCYGFLQKSRFKIDEVTATRKEVDRMLTRYGWELGLSKAKNFAKDANELRKVCSRYRIDKGALASFVLHIRSSNEPVTWIDVHTKVKLQFELKEDAEEHWQLCHMRDRHTRMDICLIALSNECKSAATPYLPHLRLVTLPENFYQSVIQCSDRHLEDCTMYQMELGLNLEGLRKLEGASLECFAPVSTADDSIQSQNNLYLRPRRCYDRLTRDLFDSGLIICDDYEAIEDHMHGYDMIQLPIIPETSPPSALERLLRLESALMEYGSPEWMEWLARRLGYFNYQSEALRFYLRSIAERDYCVQDERLIKRLHKAFGSRKIAQSKSQKMELDAYVYSDMDTLEKFRRLVVIDPPYASKEALNQLSNFVRSIRMPPS